MRISVFVPPTYPRRVEGSGSFNAPAFDPRQGYHTPGPSNLHDTRVRPQEQLVHPYRGPSNPVAGSSIMSLPAGSSFGGHASDKSQMDPESRMRSSPDSYTWDDDSPIAWAEGDSFSEGYPAAGPSTGPRVHGKVHSQRRPSNRDEFDGPHQFLDRPAMDVIAAQEKDLPHLPTNLYVNEQDEILSLVNDRLSKCAFDFVAKYQFPIPLESDKRPVRIPADREWTEWVYLLKRLATKRRVPARVLYNGQIKQFVTVLENSLEMRHAAKHQSRPLKDDRNVLQLISAGLQVARILRDAAAMQFLDNLYVQTEKKIQSRQNGSSLRA